MSRSFIPTEHDLSRRAILDDLDRQLKIQAARLHSLEERTKIVSDQNAHNQTDAKLHLTYDCSQKCEETGGDSDDEPLVVKLSRQVKSFSKTGNAKVVSNKSSNIDNDALLNKSAKKTGRIVKKYNPTYTWNRGGRIKELRIRYRARKFFYLWRDHALGRVLPSRALQFYQDGLKQRMWNIWFTRYWIEYKEVRLNLRADGHYRYVLTSRYLTDWRIYVNLKKSELAKIRLADKWHLAQTLKRAFHCWRSFPKKQLMRKHLMVTAQNFHNRLLLKQSWSMWCHAMLKVNSWIEKENTANHLYEQKLKLRFFSLWKSTLAQHEKGKSLMKIAISYHNGILKDYYFRCWQLYMGDQKKERTIKRRCDAHYRHALLQRFCQSWIKALSRLRELQSMEEKRQELRNKSLMRLAMERWKFYLSIQEHEARLKMDAMSHYEYSLKKRHFLRLQQFHALQHKRREMVELAQRFRRRKLLYNCYDWWVNKLDAKEENRLLNKTRIARASRRRMLLKIHFTKWRQYVRMVKEKFEKVHLADNHFYRTVLPSCFNRWKDYTNTRIHKSQLKLLADEHYRRNIVSIVWENWCSALQVECEQRYHERVAVLHDRARLLSSVLRLWHTRTEHLLNEKNWELSAEEHRRRSIMKYTMKRWKLFVRLNCRKRERLCHVDEIYQRNLLRAAFRNWRLIVSTRVRQRRIISGHRQLVQTRVLKKIVASWKEITESSKQQRLIALKLADDKASRNLRSFWNSWKQGVEFAKKRRIQTSVARRNFERIIVTKLFSAWRFFAVDHKCKKKQTFELVVDARYRLNQSIARRYLHHWMNQRDSLLLERLAMSRSIIYHDRVCLTKSLAAWRSLVVRKQKERLLKRQADWLYEKRTLGNAWYQWHWSLSIKLHLDKQNARALWHWSLSLQARVWAAWREWTLARSRQKERENGALQRFRNGLLTRGLAQWASVAWNMRVERERNALNTLKYLSPRQISVALKYGIHWRQTVLRRRGGQAGLWLHSFRVNPTHSQHPALPTPARLPTGALVIQSLEFKESSQLELPAHLPVLSKRPAPAFPDFMRSSLAREGLLEDECSHSKDQDNNVELEKVVEESGDQSKLQDDYSEIENDLLPPEFFLNGNVQKTKCPTENRPLRKDLSVVSRTEQESVSSNFIHVNNSAIPPDPVDHKEILNKELIRELRQIKSQLKKYDDSRQHLKSLHQRLLSLTAILEEKSFDENDLIVSSLKKEIESLKDEKQNMKRTLCMEKTKCKELSVRAQEIITILKL